jgi:CheY-like chemotaxis protein
MNFHKNTFGSRTPSAAPAARPVGTTAPDSGTQRPRLLIVEDNADLLHLTSMLLANEGFEVSTASDAEEALEMLETRPFDAIFSDVVMPGMSGVELGSIVRRHYPDMVIILTSGYIGGANPTARLENLMVPKPYQATAVAALIYQQLSLGGKH